MNSYASAVMDWVIVAMMAGGVLFALIGLGGVLISVLKDMFKD